MTTLSPAGVPGAVAPQERGSTTVADRVVAKIAAHAARTALRSLAPTARTGAHATVTIRRRDTRRDFGEAQVRVTVELGYPAPIGAQCAAVRREVTERVRALAGMAVTEVAVEVERLHSPLQQPAGRERVR